MEPLRVLLADADPAVCELFERALPGWGYLPLVANDGIRAWEVLQACGSPDILAMAWRLPGMDGIEVCRGLRAQSSRELPYILLMADEHDGHELARALDAGADDYLRKPITESLLRARLEDAARCVSGMSARTDVASVMRGVSTTRRVPQAPTQASLVGWLVGDRFRVLAPVRSEANLALWEGHDEVTKHRVAIWFLEASDDSLLPRTERRARALAALRKQGVTAVHDFGTTAGGLTYVVCDFLDTWQLREAMRKSTPLRRQPSLSPGEAAQVLTDDPFARLSAPLAPAAPTRSSEPPRASHAAPAPRASQPPQRPPSHRPGSLASTLPPPRRSSHPPHPSPSRRPLHLAPPRRPSAAPAAPAELDVVAPRPSQVPSVLRAPTPDFTPPPRARVTQPPPVAPTRSRAPLLQAAGLVATVPFAGGAALSHAHRPSEMPPSVHALRSATMAPPPMRAEPQPLAAFTAAARSVAPAMRESVPPPPPMGSPRVTLPPPVRAALAAPAAPGVDPIQREFDRALRVRDFTLARSLVTWELEGQPRDAAAHARLGMLRARQGDREGAIAAYRESIALDPRKPDVHRRLAFLQRAMGDRAGAIASLRALIALQPTDRAAHVTLARLLATP